MEPHRGTLILVFGILGLVVCQIFAIVAWVMGNQDLKKMAEGSMDPEGQSLTNAGRICGIIGVILMAISLVFVVIYFAFFGTMMATSGAFEPGALDGLQGQ